MNLHTPVNDHYKIAFIGNYLPRRCGLATFTTDLCESIALAAGENADCFAVPMNDVPEGYAYPERVRFEVRQHAREDYLMAADYFNLNQVDVVCLQHEYGIFGGSYGSFILDLLKRLRMPIVTTLHTILKEPTGYQRLIIQELGKISDRLVVMSHLGQQFLEDIYKIPSEKIVYIPHGIPDVPFMDSSYYKDQFGVEGRKVILTFGLLSPGKGIEYMIDALPEIIRTHPDVIYIVLGATHPHVRKQNGEEYRQSLQQRVLQLGLQDHVLFHNRFVELQELCEYLGVADLYVTPYLNPTQIVSGTLAYSLGAGKAVLSTPYWHAEELLAEGRGCLVPFRNSQTLAEQINDLLDNEIERNAIRRRAYQYSRQMVWSQVAQDYMRVFQEVREERVHHPRPLAQVAKQSPVEDHRLPEIDLRHLRLMTDDTGMLQHCSMSTPDRRHGYTTDDNARALIAAVRYWCLRQDQSVIDLIQTYLAFLLYAYNEENNRYRNFMRYDRVWLEEIGSQDSHGRAIWAMGETVAYAPNQSILALATRTFKASLIEAEHLDHPRSWAFALLGIHSYLRRFSGDSEARRCREVLAYKLFDAFQRYSTEGWVFCADLLSYDNARPPQALLMSGQWLNNPEMIEMGLKSLLWLLDLQTNETGAISIIGNKGWYYKCGERHRFDQQPTDANALVEACIEAYHVTQDKVWLHEANRCFQWFMGNNDLKVPLIDFSTGGCRDSLTPDGVNQNQGAESSLALLLSVLAMYEHEQEMILHDLQTEHEEKVKALPSVKQNLEVI